ncbi:MAG: pilin [bacterium]|nr:pilin [bacterium]
MKEPFLNRAFRVALHTALISVLLAFFGHAIAMDVITFNGNIPLPLDDKHIFNEKSCGSGVEDDDASYLFMSKGAPRVSPGCFCPDDKVICGVWAQSGTLKKPLCCDLTSEAVSAGVGLTGDQIYKIDSEANGGEMQCSPGDVLVGSVWAKSEQIDFGLCQPLGGVKLEEGREVRATVSGGGGLYAFCNLDEIACGAKNISGDNDEWGSIYCCKVTLSTVVVSAFKAEDPGTQIGGIAFDLARPADTVSDVTTYTNEASPPGSYVLTVPDETTDKFPGYACKIYSTADSTEADCADGSAAAALLAGQQVEFFIKYERGACVPQNCGDVVAGGAQCGQFSDGCGTCNPPDDMSGCLDCGICVNPGEVCTIDGKCTSEFNASCRVIPGIITEGESAQFTINTANGTEPFTCAWSSTNPVVNGKASCSFSETFAAAGTYNAQVTITDSSSPQKSKTASCVLTVNRRGGGGEPPEPIVPNYSLCEAYKVVIYYGMTLFGIIALIGGLMMLFALGDPSRVSNGKKALGAGIVGLLVVLLAKPIFSAIMLFLGFEVLLCGQIIP